MSLTWMNNGFICKDLYAPFVLEKDSDYLEDLKKKYKIVIQQAGMAGADDESLKILKKFQNKILEALKCYYKADIEKCNTIIRNLIKSIGEDPFAVSPLKESYAFPGGVGTELQLFRCRMGNPSNAYVAKDMLHLPLKLRAKSGNYRFSIPGNPSLYKQLCASLTYRDYELRCTRTGFITNIGSYDRQYPYAETKYSDFDKFLFSSWKNKPNGKGKDQIPWGVPVD